MRALVIKSTGSSQWVYTPEGETIECKIKGNFRIRGIRSTNPVAVGDYVEVVQQEDGTNWITEIEDRKNFIVRRSTNLSKESHILAANLDQVALIVTINHPVTSTTFIDRFLATCEAYRVPAVLIFNKIDLLTENELTLLADLRALYESLGYPTYAISAKEMTAISAKQLNSEALNGPQGHLNSSSAALNSEALNALFSGKITLLSGNSGVGKSTLLNAIFGEEKTRTGLISSAHDKGMHTTTFSEMYPLNSEALNSQPTGWLIDTPGIKGFGAINMEKEEVSHYFREIFRIGDGCKYSNCLHTGERGCVVEDAVVRGDIAVSRFESYLSLLGDCDEAKYR